MGSSFYSTCPFQSLLVEANSWLLLDPFQVDLVAEQLTDVRDAVLHHGGSLERQSETVHAHVLGQAHGLQHLRTEHARVTNLEPALEALVVAEDFHTRLRKRLEIVE
jgi:hypothetical protein